MKKILVFVSLFFSNFAFAQNMMFCNDFKTNYPAHMDKVLAPNISQQTTLVNEKDKFVYSFIFNDGKQVVNAIFAFGSQDWVATYILDKGYGEYKVINSGYCIGEDFNTETPLFAIEMVLEK